MSTEVVEVVKEKKSEPLFSKKNRKLISNPLGIGNLFSSCCYHSNETGHGNGDRPYGGYH
jgi:hypothetical protein